MCPIQQQSISDRKCGRLVTGSGKHNEGKFTRDFKQSIVSLSRGKVLDSTSC